MNPFDEGISAYRQGIERYTNPYNYQTDTENYRQWYLGWDWAENNDEEINDE